MFSKLLRIGRDAELRTTANGTSVCSIAGVYDVGFGDKKRPQWIDAVLWGKQSEALAPYLLKGNQVVIYADDLELETYTKGHELVRPLGHHLPFAYLPYSMLDKESQPAISQYYLNQHSTLPT